MGRDRDHPNIEVKPGVLLLLSVMLVLLPIRWMMAWLLASLIHEVGHYLSVRLCGGRIVSIRAGVNGAKMETQPLTPMKSVLCSAGGPVFGLGLLLVAERFPRLALCGLVQSVYNLLPLYPLDGGRILRNLLFKLESRTVFMIEIGILIAVVTWMLYATVAYRLGILPVGISAILVIQCVKTKITCKG